MQFIPVKQQKIAFRGGFLFTYVNHLDVPNMCHLRLGGLPKQSRLPDLNFKNVCHISLFIIMPALNFSETRLTKCGGMGSRA